MPTVFWYFGCIALGWALKSMEDRAVVMGTQRDLSQLGMAVRLTGEMDLATAHALAAFQRAVGLPDTGAIDGRTLAALQDAVRRAARMGWERRLEGGAHGLEGGAHGLEGGAGQSLSRPRG